MLAPLCRLANLGYCFHRLVWRPAPDDAATTGIRRGTVHVVPLPLPERAAVRETLNLLALPSG